MFEVNPVGRNRFGGRARFFNRSGKYLWNARFLRALMYAPCKRKDSFFAAMHWTRPAHKLRGSLTAHAR